jgi:hypothetical protein
VLRGIPFYLSACSCGRVEVRLEAVLRALWPHPCSIGEFCRILVGFYSLLFVKWIVLINSAVSCYNYLSVCGRWMNVSIIGGVILTGKPKYLDIKLPQSYFVHHNFTWTVLGLNLLLYHERPAPNHLSHGVAFVNCKVPFCLSLGIRWHLTFEAMMTSWFSYLSICPFVLR